MSRRMYAIGAIAVLALTLAGLSWASPSPKRHQLGNWGAAARGKLGVPKGHAARMLRGEHREHHGHGEKVHTIRRTWVPNSFAQNDVGDPGISAGDTYSFGGPLFTVDSHERRGFLSGTCTWTGPLGSSGMAATCQVTTTLQGPGPSPSSGPQITLQGFNDTSTVPFFKQAITGGTGKWRDARGDVIVKGGGALIVFHVII